jgi:4-hydroxyphenylpyruvate dioxygenase-like putative hemolysin
MAMASSNSDQRAGRGQEKVAGREISRFLQRRRRAARRDRDKGYRDHVTELQKRGVEFLNIPTTYYDTVLDRVGHIDEDLEPSARLAFWSIVTTKVTSCKSLPSRGRPPTLFFEIIQRKGAQSFGKGNFKALFEALEKEQDAEATSKER